MDTRELVLRVENIIDRYNSGNLTDDLDETGNNGFWDLAGELADWDMNKQELIYNALKKCLAA